MCDLRGVGVDGEGVFCQRHFPFSVFQGLPSRTDPKWGGGKVVAKAVTGGWNYGCGARSGGCEAVGGPLSD